MGRWLPRRRMGTGVDPPFSGIWKKFVVMARTFEDFYYNLPEQEKVIVDLLRELVLEAAPNFREKISYNVPYYFLNSRVCYIWPASVKPGPRAGVVFGLCRGQMLSNEQGLLELENRKEIGTITFRLPEEIDQDAVREILYEAILVDEEIAREKRKKPKG